MFYFFSFQVLIIELAISTNFKKIECNPNQLPSIGIAVSVEHALHPAIGEQSQSWSGGRLYYPGFGAQFPSCTICEKETQKLSWENRPEISALSYKMLYKISRKLDFVFRLEKMICLFWRTNS